MFTEKRIPILQLSVCNVTFTFPYGSRHVIRQLSVTFKASNLRLVFYLLFPKAELKSAF